MGSRTLQPYGESAESSSKVRLSKSGPAPKKNVSQACTQCRQRRVKCGGQRPICESCYNTDSECIYEAVADRRSSLYRHRTPKQLQERLTELESLVGRLEKAPDEVARRQLALLRASGLSAVTNIRLGSRESSGSIKSSPSAMESETATMASSSPAIGSPTPADHKMADVALNLERLRSVFSSAFGGAVMSESDVRSRNSEIADVYRVQSEVEKWHVALRSAPGHGRSTRQGSLDEALGAILLEGSTPVSDLNAEAVPFRPTPQRSTSSNNPLPIASAEAFQSRFATTGYIQVFALARLADMVVEDGYPEMFHFPHIANFKIPRHVIQISSEYEASLLSRAYLDYRDQARGWLAKGESLTSVTGPGYVNVDLFFRDRDAQNDPRTVCFWAAQLVNALGQSEEIWQRLALASFLTHLMRWIVNPTAESFALVPDIMKPTPAQCLIPHHPTADLAIFPECRDALVYKFRDHVELLTRSIYLNWPYTMAEAVEIDMADNAHKLTPLFEVFAADQDNWSVRSAFLDVFPEMIGRVQVVD